MQSRRDFIRTAAGSAMALGVSSSLDAASSRTEWRNRQDGMVYRRLGRTDCMVSEIVMGGNEINPDNYDHVLQAIDLGLNYLDTSPAYGRGKSELGFREVLRARSRDLFFLTSKVSLWDVNRGQLYRKIFDSLPESQQKGLRTRVRDEIEASGSAEEDYLVNYFGAQRGELDDAVLCNLMEKEYGRSIDRKKNYKQVVIDSVHESLRRLQTDHLDTLMCPHGASSPAELLNYPEVFEAFDELKQAGKVRFLGVSSHSDPAGVLRAANQSGVYSVAMVAYNIVNHRFVAPVLKESEDAGVGVIAMKVARPLYAGPNREPAAPDAIAELQHAVPGDWSVPQKAYLWALQNQSLSGVISNMVNREQVAANLPLPLARFQS